MSQNNSVRKAQEDPHMRSVVPEAAIKGRDK